MSKNTSLSFLCIDMCS